MNDIIPNSELSEAVDSLKKLSEPTPQQTIEQISQELNAWLQERGVTLQIVAIGFRSGQPCPIDDFLPTTHTATVTIVKATQK